MTTCVHTKELNAYLARQDADDFEHKWKEEWLDEKVADAVKELTTKGFTETECGVWKVQFFICDYLEEYASDEHAAKFLTDKTDFWEYVEKDLRTHFNEDEAYRKMASDYEDSKYDI